MAPRYNRQCWRLTRLTRWCKDNFHIFIAPVLPSFNFEQPSGDKLKSAYYIFNNRAMSVPTVVEPALPKYFETLKCPSGISKHNNEIRKKQNSSAAINLTFDPVQWKINRYISISSVWRIWIGKQQISSLFIKVENALTLLANKCSLQTYGAHNSLSSCPVSWD